MGRSKPHYEPQIESMPGDAVWLSSHGLWVGNNLLVDHGAPSEGHARLEAMLAIAFQRRLSEDVRRSVEAAIEESRRGDQGLANLRLALAGHTRIANAQTWPVRMAAAQRLLADGLTTNELLSSFDRGEASNGDLTKYAPDQPRVPAGSGRESGRWTRAIASAAAALARRGASVLASALSTETLAALSTFAATVGFTETLGTLFVPSPNSTSSSGPLPGDTENTFSYDHEEGLLRILGPSGFVLAAGRKDGTGLFLDENTDIAFAREVDGALVFDSASLKAVAKPVAPATAVTTKEEEGEEDEEDEPKLCPDPGPDQPGSDSASKRARAYQKQISFMINPHRPLRYGLAMNLVNPFTAKIVHYDECDERTGTMIEAKGPGFNGLLSFPAGYENVTEDWLDQGKRELQAAGARQVVWYFAEDHAASIARNLFAGRGLGKIIVRYQPPV